MVFHGYTSDRYSQLIITHGSKRELWYRAYETDNSWSTWNNLNKLPGSTSISLSSNGYTGTCEFKRCSGIVSFFISFSAALKASNTSYTLATIGSASYRPAIKQVYSINLVSNGSITSNRARLVIDTDGSIKLLSSTTDMFEYHCSGSYAIE